MTPASLTFTADNWTTPQTVTITGVDDCKVDGNKPYTIRLAPAVSTDSRYAGMDPADVSVTNLDKPITQPRVLDVTQLDGAPAGHLRIAIDFSEAMDPTAASQAANYTISLRMAPGCKSSRPVIPTWAACTGHARNRREWWRPIVVGYLRRATHPRKPQECRRCRHGGWSRQCASSRQRHQCRRKCRPPGRRQHRAWASLVARIQSTRELRCQRLRR